jgi:hypothetical protein
MCPFYFIFLVVGLLFILVFRGTYFVPTHPDASFYLIEVFFASMILIFDCGKFGLRTILVAVAIGSLLGMMLRLIMKEFTAKVGIVVWTTALVLPIALYLVHAFLMTRGIEPNTLIGLILLTMLLFSPVRSLLRSARRVSD